MYWIIPYILLLVFAYFSHKKKALDTSGVMAALMLGAVILQCGWEYLAVLSCFFVLCMMATWNRHSKKPNIWPSDRYRSAENVFGNGLVASFFALLGHPYAFIGAISAATADTISSEVGVFSKGDPIMITTLERVPKGTDGGVSPLGEAAGSTAAVIIGICSVIFGFNDPVKAMLAAVLGGVIGFNVDSLLGALFETRHMLGNHSVNFLCTAAGAFSAFFVYLM